MKTISLRKIAIPDTILSLVKCTTAHRYKVLPVKVTGDILSVAIDSDVDLFAISDKLENETGYEIECLLADDRDSLLTALKRYYLQNNQTSNNATVLFNTILNRALQLRASDIHLSPDEEGADLQLRIDGALRTDRRIDY
ncbi:MAG: hypothetical protein ACRC37_04690, partial [Lentisphaeria bacterium]